MANYIDHGYYNPMDREYDVSVGERVAPHDIAESVAFIDEDFMGKLKASIFRGASKAELAFFGAGKSAQVPAPETITKEERQVIRDMALVNEMKLTTHAFVKQAGLAGLGDQGFSEATRKESINEIKRAIDFAADATTGGAVVFHTGEFPRMVKEAKERYGMMPEKEEEDKEELGAFHYLMDKRSGQLIKTVRDNETIFRPVVRRDNDGNIIYEKDEYDPFKDDEKLPQYIYDKKTGGVKLEPISFKDYAEEQRKLYPDKDEKEITKGFFIESQRSELMQQVGYAREHDDRREIAEMTLKSLESKEANLRDEIKDITSRDLDSEYIMYKDRLIRQGLSEDQIIAKSDYEKKIKKELEKKQAELEMIPFERRKSEHERQYARDLATAYKAKFEKAKHDFNQIQDLETFGLGKTAKSMGELGLFALDKNELAKKSMPEQYKKEYTDIFIAPENLFPEQYGGHPQELRKIVHDGRAEMAKRLQKERGYTEKEAEESAAKHIKATFDTGHANIWWKYFDHDPDKSIDDNRKDFNKWLVKEFRTLVKEGVIGHVHLTDNLGYNDEHLVAGHGAAPIQDLMKVLKEEKPELLKEMVVESGTLNYKTILQDTWAELSSPIYATHRAPGQTLPRFGDMRSSYLGQTNSPRFIFGEYAPSKEYLGEPFWSGIGLE